MVPEVLLGRATHVSLKRELQLGQTISLRRRLADGTKREAKARVIVKEKDTANGFAYGVSFVDAKTDFWGIEFPSRAQAAGAMVRLLVECTHCHSQELAYLGRRELKEYETHRMFARQCRMCEAPEPTGDATARVTSPGFWQSA